MLRCSINTYLNPVTKVVPTSQQLSANKKKTLANQIKKIPMVGTMLEKSRRIISRNAQLRDTLITIIGQEEDLNTVRQTIVQTVLENNGDVVTMTKCWTNIIQKLAQKINELPLEEREKFYLSLQDFSTDANVAHYFHSAAAFNRFLKRHGFDFKFVQRTMNAVNEEIIPGMTIKIGTDLLSDNQGTNEYFGLAAPFKEPSIEDQTIPEIAPLPCSPGIIVYIEAKSEKQGNPLSLGPVSSDFPRALYYAMIRLLFRKIIAVNPKAVVDALKDAGETKPPEYLPEILEKLALKKRGINSPFLMQESSEKACCTK